MHLEHIAEVSRRGARWAAGRSIELDGPVPILVLAYVERGEMCVLNRA